MSSVYNTCVTIRQQSVFRLTLAPSQIRDAASLSSACSARSLSKQVNPSSSGLSKAVVFYECNQEMKFLCS